MENNRRILDLFGVTVYEPRPDQILEFTEYNKEAIQIGAYWNNGNISTGLIFLSELKDQPTMEMVLEKANKFLEEIPNYKESIFDIFGKKIRYEGHCRFIKIEEFCEVFGRQYYSTVDYANNMLFLLPKSNLIKYCLSLNVKTYFLEPKTQNEVIEEFERQKQIYLQKTKSK